MSIKWNSRFTKLAITVSKWSKDHKQVGCVIVDEDTNKVLSLGFNGMPSWFSDDNLTTLSSYDKGRMITHSEINALNSLGKEHYNKNLTMYITKPPCKWCSLNIVNSTLNINKLYYIVNYSDPSFNDRYQVDLSFDILEKSGIKVIPLAYTEDYTFHLAVSDYSRNCTDEICIDEINSFIFHSQDLIENLDAYLKKDTSYYDSIIEILEEYSLKAIHKFSLEVGSVSAMQFLKWYQLNKDELI